MIAGAVRRRLRVSGTVQGVGFRPYAYRLASDLGLAGHVRNDSQGVLLEVEGSAERVEEFCARLPEETPALARVEELAVQECEPTGARGFEILDSAVAARRDAAITPDSATCRDCLAELFDPADRRYRYAFINCTNCGPRFTIVRGTPYDRPLTTMASFRMCPDCRHEYEDPLDRRFHAQPNACPRCGPRLALLDRRGARLDAADPIRAAADALLAGRIVAVKGIGGYHLACRADDEGAVAALRARKHREDKPFALMARDLEAAVRLVELPAQERALLGSPARPIILAPRRPGAPVASAVAPHAGELGVMLPYSPLHHLLMADAGTTLVLTSGNVSDEPIAFRDRDALERLGKIADLFITHDRPIETRTDDSVLRVVPAAGSPRTVWLRRSRGCVPQSTPLPGAGTPVHLLACGAELKSTFCLAKDSRAWVSHHIGDLENFETYRSFAEGVEHFRAMFSVDPQVVVHDLHPDYLSTRYARESDGADLIAVQHHHAHLAACLAEHDEAGPAVGAIFDGTGYGPDGTVWGGEILLGDLRDFARVGHLLPVRLPGGPEAIRQPWRMAAAWLAAAGADPPPALVDRVDRAAWANVGRLLDSGVASPLTSSMGRLFDAVAAICGLRLTVNYEGQAAIELEAACDPAERGRYPISVENGTIDPREAIGRAAAEVIRGESAQRIASRFHTGVARATIDACARAAAENGTEVVALSGGVFANRRLLAQVADGLSATGLRVLIPYRLPVGDGGISYGQAAVAAARLGA